MSYRWIGAILVISSCAGFGFSAAAAYRREIHILRQIIGMADLMESELNYRLTPLPELCRRTGKLSGGVIRKVLYRLAEELDRQICPDAASCMRCALSETGNLPRSAQRILSGLGGYLGQYDLSGQLKGLDTVRTSCSRALQKLEQNRESRLRSYQTLGLCAGAALVILFI